MSLNDIKVQNQNIVTEKALELFIANGIENTKIKDIARKANLTERSVYRYFSSKTDLVQAAAFCFYNRILENANDALIGRENENLCGLDQMRILLYRYAELFFEQSDMLRFTVEAEMYLYNAKKNSEMVNRPPANYDTGTTPFLLAIKKAVKDGSISNKIDPKEMYYNTYDAVLGVMQKIFYNSEEIDSPKNKERLMHVCDIFINVFKNGY